MMFFLLICLMWNVVSTTAVKGVCPLHEFPDVIYDGDYVKAAPGTVLTVSCKRRFLEAYPKITCKDGKWSDPEPPCTLVDCAFLHQPAKARIEMPCRHLDCSITYFCPEGTWYDGTVTRYCQRNGTWTGVPGECEDVQCPEPSDPPNGTMSQAGRSYGNITTLQCDEGFFYNNTGDDKRRCQGNNTWSGQAGECEAVRCPLLAEPQNGQVQYTGRSYLSTATVQCDEGYTYSRREHIIRQCLGNNTWNGEQGTCDRIVCPSILDVENGILSSRGARYQDSVTLQCHSGHILDGPSSVKCEADGTWSAEMGQCLKPGRTAEIQRTVLPSVLVPILLLCVIGVGFWLRWYCRKHKESEANNIPTLNPPERDAETARLLEPNMLHCSFTFKEDFTAEYSGINSPEYNTFKFAIGKAVKSAIELKFKTISDVKVEVITLCQNNKTTFIDIEARGITREDIESALPELNIVFNRAGRKVSYHIMKDSITYRERPIHNIVAHICTKMHKPDKHSDKRIDIEQQYVKLKLQTSETLGAMRRAALERPDLYQQGLESTDGKEIEDEDLIKGRDFEKYVLLRGRAGIGKSTLVQRLLWKWANDEWATQFKVLFLLNLRYLMTKDTPTTLMHLLSLYSVYNTGNAGVIIGAEWLKDNQGKIGFILDGIDEVQNFNTKWTSSDTISDVTMEAKPLDWCFSLMKKENLPSSTIIVSSRPFADLTLIEYTRRKKGLSTYIVELMGLTRERVMEFVDKIASEERREYIKQTLNNNILLLSVSSITFYCAALCHILGDEDETLPKLTTYTQITAYIMQAYIWRSMRKEGKSIQKKLHQSLRQPLALLSQLACDGLLNQSPGGVPHLIFDESDFEKLNIGNTDMTEVKKSGLLMESDIWNPQEPNSKQVLREFVHLSIQELLAMAGLLKCSCQRVEATVQTLSGSGQFGMALLFLYGLAFNEENETLNSIFTALAGSPEEKNEIRNVLLDLSDTNISDSLQALQIAHESQSGDVAKMIGSKIFKKEISIKGTKLTAIDITAMAFLLRNYKSMHTIKLTYVDMDHILLQEVVRLLEGSSNIECLELTDRVIDNYCLRDLMVAINRHHSLRSLILASPTVSDIGVRAVASTVETNDMITKLSLTCALTNDGLEMIGNALTKNNTLNELFLVANPYVDKGSSSTKNISEALKVNTSLATLSLMSKGINDKGLKHLGEAVRINKTLKHLRILSGSLTDVGVKYIADALRVNTTLVELCLRGFRIGQKGSVALLDILMHNKKVSIRMWEPHCSDETLGRIKCHRKITCE